MENDRGVAWFIGLAFGLAWVIWGAAFLVGIRPGHPLFTAVSIPAGFAPAVAALVVRLWITKEGFSDAGLRPKLKRNWPFYLMGWLYPVFAVGLILLLSSLFGIGEFDLTFKGASRFTPEGGPTIPAPAIVIPVQLLLSSIVTSAVLWGEEFGWRGYLQQRLFPGRPLAAAVSTGVIWGVWHYPINILGYNYPQHPILGLFLFPVATVLLSIFFGWLMLRTGSIWAPSLAHASFNTVGASLVILLFLKGDLLWISPAGLFGLVPLGIVCAWIVFSGQLQPRTGV